MSARRSTALWIALILVLAAAFSWWVLHPVPAGHRPHRIARNVAPTAIPQSGSALPAPLPTATPLSSAPSPVMTRARLAIIIDDCGQWIETERGFVALSIPVTLSVLPDVPYTKEIASEAAAGGKGVMLHLPMEPISQLNPGPGKITTEMSNAAIERQVENDLADVPFAQGVNNHEGSKATADPRVMRAVAEAIVRHGNLFFVDSLTVGDSVAASSTRDAGIPTATRDVFLDNRADVAYTQAQLRAAAAIAREHGVAIAIGHPRPSTLAALRAIIPELQAEGIRFVLVRDLVGDSPALQPSQNAPGRR
ncbi:MAG TPA: divergent polysaccharide deacetylase family protein [Candidatus Tyrphobacter sp.]